MAKHTELKHCFAFLIGWSLLHIMEKGFSENIFIVCQASD